MISQNKTRNYVLVNCFCTLVPSVNKWLQNLSRCFESLWWSAGKWIGSAHAVKFNKWLQPMWNICSDRALTGPLIEAIHPITTVCRNTVAFLSLPAYYKSRAHSNHRACHLVSSIYAVVKHVTEYILCIHMRGPATTKTEILSAGFTETCAPSRLPTSHPIFILTGTWL